MTSFEGHPCAILLEGGDVTELLVGSESPCPQAGNVYLGRVQDIVPGLQAAFVEIGLKRTGFLPLQEPRVDKPPPRAGDLIWVRIMRPPQGQKGARLTREIALPGQGVVFLPEGKGVSFSRHLAGVKQRKTLESTVLDILHDGEGAVLRTAAVGLGKEKLVQELETLRAVWLELCSERERDSAPRLVWDESSLARNVARHWLMKRANEVWFESEEKRVEASAIFGAPVFSGHLSVHVSDGEPSLVYRFGLRKALSRCRLRRLWLPSGGGLVFDQTEALTAVDVNSGRFSGKRAFQELALKVNLEAAREVARQVRLRGIAGIIVVDFIDLESVEDRQKLHECLEKAFERDSAKIRILPMSEIGLVQITRQRVAPGLGVPQDHVCADCLGTGRSHGEAYSLEQIHDAVWSAIQSSSSGVLTIYALPALAEALFSSGLMAGFQKQTDVAVGVQEKEDLDGLSFRIEHR